MFKPMWILAVLLRPLRLVAIGLLVAAIVLGLVYGPWLAAQARTVGVLATAYNVPIVSWVTHQFTDQPRLVDTTIAGTPVTLVNPTGEGPWHTIVLLNGATEAGRFDPDVLEMAAGLGRVGHRVVIVDSPDPERGDLNVEARTDVLRVARALVRAPETRDGEVSLFGLGLGGTLALLTAEDPQLGPNVPLVVAVSSLTDLVEMGRLATTGYHRTSEGLEQLPVPPGLLRTASDVLLEALPSGPTRDLLATELDEVLAEDSGDTFAALAELPPGLLDPEAQAVVDLLVNDDPEAYDALYAALPASIRTTIELLSPVTNARRLQSRVELAAAANDPNVPLAQAESLERAAPDVRVTVSDAFSSTAARPSLGGPGDFLRIDALLVRALHEIRNH